MAKLNGPLGSKLRGKVGEVVAAKTVGGDTAIRAYQPVVKNPKTERQQAARNRFAMASGIVACFSTAIQIGYAQAVNGMRMYPRNLAVRDILASSEFMVQQSVDEFNIDATSFPVSKRAGIIVKPSCSYVAPVGATDGSLTCTNYSAVEINESVEKLGVVYVVGRIYEDGDCEFLAVKQSEASVPVTITEAEAGAWSDAYVWAFFKKVPISGTIIPTTDTPWKYPSDTGESAMVAHLS